MISEIATLALVTGSIYCMLALGFTLIYSVGRIENLAHGTILMVAAYVYWLFHEGGPFRLPFYIAFPIAILSGACLDLAVYFAIVKRNIKDPTVVWISTYIFAFVMENVVGSTFSYAPFGILPIIRGSYKGPITVTGTGMLIICLNAIVVSLFWLYMTRSSMGRKIRGLAVNFKGIVRQGINPRTPTLTVWSISGVLCSIAGVLMGMFTHIDPYMWFFPLIMSFSVVILGGLGSIIGTIIASYIVGFVESTVVIGFGEPRLRMVIGMIILMVILLIRPRGLLGRE
ncbi:MAG: branched-chain amino acid ABC transporter permease [Candidatus Bathyarchaeia archaeon]